MGGYGNSGKEAVRLWIQISKDGRDVKAVDEEGGTTTAFGVPEQMEKLYSAGIGEISVVRMGGQCVVRIRRVAARLVGGEAPKLSVWPLRRRKR